MVGYGWFDCRYLEWVPGNVHQWKRSLCCIGSGWRLPTAADWQNLKNYDDLDGALAAYMSNLKLPAGGFRSGNGGFVYAGGESYYWSATASGSYAIRLFISDNTYLASLQASQRGEGFICRCLRD